MTRFCWLLFAFMALAACGNMPQPFSKDAPLPPGDTLVAPPWEAMVKAGPGAVNDIDLETLHGPQSTAVTAEDPAQAPEAPAAEAGTRESAKPRQVASVAIKAVTVGAVTGDSDSGNRELANAMRETLKKAGWPVRPKKAADTLIITGRVRIGEPRGPVQTVSLAWEVLDPAGKSLGLVSQTNDVPSGSLAAGWGENATAAVEAAATGIFALIDKLR